MAPSPGKGRHACVYLDEENRVTDLVERLKAFGAEPDELDSLKLYSFAQPAALDTPAGGFHLLALAVTAGPISWCSTPPRA